MGFILIGVIIAIVLNRIALKCNSKDGGTILIVLAIFVFATGIVSGLFAPMGYKQPKEEIKTVNLINLSDETTVVGEKGLFYISINATNSYTYYTQIDSEFADEESKAYISNIVSGEEDVTIVEQESCSNPRLVIYCEKSKITFWSFGIGASKTYYVFYVPQNTVMHNFELG